MKTRISYFDCTALLTGLVLAAGTAWALDAEKFAMLSTGITRAAAVEIVGTPDSEHCATSIGLRVCRLTWIPRSILGPKTTFRATFVSDRLIASSTCQSAQGCVGKE